MRKKKEETHRMAECKQSICSFPLLKIKGYTLSGY